jgi:hypothetical protein
MGIDWVAGDAGKLSTDGYSGDGRLDFDAEGVPAGTTARPNPNMAQALNERQTAVADSACGDEHPRGGRPVTGIVSFVR